VRWPRASCLSIAPRPKRRSRFLLVSRCSRPTPRYPTLVRGFNLRWVGRPAYVAVCATADQVVQAVDDKRRITVRGDGHCYEDFASNNDGGVIIDLSSMTAIWRDPTNGWYGVEGGATLWDVYRRLFTEYGVTLPAGSCYSVGIGGHVTGGATACCLGSTA